jgi:hypothetical protein
MYRASGEYPRQFNGETVGLNAGSGSGIAYLMNADQLITLAKRESL